MKKILEFGYIVQLKEYTKKSKKDGKLYEWKQRVIIIPSEVPFEPSDLGPYVMYKHGEGLIVLRKIDKI